VRKQSLSLSEPKRQLSVFLVFKTRAIFKIENQIVHNLN